MEPKGSWSLIHELSMISVPASLKVVHSHREKHSESKVDIEAIGEYS